ncbi:hypothetical protein FRB94_010449 [Tulasnella sp. JGI-2019a]|nr:hypothetical protein FRB94_010449 [Tulasnella sp. JGI-2019a]KAG9018302.1 hypothetical protein FRB93_000005 [Tulasnella sp. JGI-2019a]KAG9020198.1 hypothetical protein FRB95_004954 [Tulasnella sp. JGI-2019a]
MIEYPQTDGWGFNFGFDFFDSDSMGWRGLSLEEEADAGIDKYMEQMKLRKENSSAAGNVVGLGVGVTMRKNQEKEEVKRVRRAKSLAKPTAR